MLDFFDRLNAIDSIPISLARWEMTGLDDEIRTLTGGVPHRGVVMGNCEIEFKWSIAH
jgi:hypothetical protein